MNELSGSQPGDERPRLHAGSDGGDISSRQPHSKRGIHVRTTPRMDVTVGGAIAWGSSVALSGEYRHLCLSHRIFEMNRGTPKVMHEHARTLRVLIRRALEMNPRAAHITEAFHGRLNTLQILQCLYSV